nr:proline-rich receptor-like protein kinase PERK1 [Quercus suber]
MASSSLQTTSRPHSHSSPPHLSAGVLTSLLLITIFITFIVMPSVISFTSQIISKLVWEKGIQTFCLVLVLFVIFCGFLNNKDPSIPSSISYSDLHPQEANLQPKDEPMDTSVTSTPSPPRQPPMLPSQQTPPRQPPMPPSRQTSVTPTSPPPCQPPMPPSQHTSVTPTPSPPRQPAMPPSLQTPPRQPAIPPSLQSPPPKNLQLPPSPPNPLPDESSSVCRDEEERSSSSDDSPDVNARAERFIADMKKAILLEG